MAVASGTPTLGDVLLREGLLTQTQLRAALNEQKNTAHSLGRVLVEKGYISEEIRTDILKKHFGLQTIDLQGVKIDPILTVLIPPAFAHKHRILPIRQESDGVLVVAMEDPSDLMVLDAVKSQVGMKIRPFIANSKDLVAALVNQYHSEHAGAHVSAASSARTRKILRGAAKAFFTFLYIAPIVIGVGAILLIEEAADFVRGMKPFDFGLYAVLLSALWAIIIFEINGLLFGHDEKAGAKTE
jgi:hypothetical protein